MADTLAAVLAAARKNRGWSLRDAERKTGVPNAHISRIETGKIRQPEITTLMALAEGYGLPLGELAEAAGHGDGWRLAVVPGAEEERIRADERRKYEDLLGDIWRRVNWHHVTEPLATEQRDLFADAVDAVNARAGTGDPGLALHPVTRWWRDDA